MGQHTEQAGSRDFWFKLVMGSTVHAAGAVLFHFMVMLVGEGLAPNAAQQLCPGCNAPLVELHEVVTVCVCTPCECALHAWRPRDYLRASRPPHTPRLHTCLQACIGLVRRAATRHGIIRTAPGARTRVAFRLQSSN